MRWFLLFAGGLIIVLVVAMVLAARLYPKQVACERFSTYVLPTPPASSTVAVPDWERAVDCVGVQNDLYMAYYVIAFAAALMGAGVVVRGE
jgi:hypothetical protein